MRRNYDIRIQGRSPEEIRIDEDKKRNAKIADRNLKTAAKVKQKSYYTVNVDCIVPCKITYRIYAEDENDAINQINKTQPINVKPNINLKKLVKATVYTYGSSLIKLIKNFRV